MSKRSLNCPYRIAELKASGLDASDIMGAHQIDRFVVNEYAAYLFFVTTRPMGGDPLVASVATAHYRVGGGRPDAHGSRPQGGEAPRGFRECAAGCGGPNVLYYTPSSGEMWGMMSLGSVVVVVGWPARSLLDASRIRSSCLTRWTPDAVDA